MSASVCLSLWAESEKRGRRVAARAHSWQPHTVPRAQQSAFTTTAGSSLWRQLCRRIGRIGPVAQPFDGFIIIIFARFPFPSQSPVPDWPLHCAGTHTHCPAASCASLTLALCVPLAAKLQSICHSRLSLVAPLTSGHRAAASPVISVQWQT